MGNHISYLDIPLLFLAAPVTFVAKSELGKWPILGECMRLVNILFVERDKSSSRSQTALAVSKAIKEEDKSIALFPSGTTTLSEEKPWRWGAFRIAKEANVSVQPFRLRYTPLRETAYIDDDVFLFHFWRLLGKGKITAEIEFGEPFRVTDVAEDLKRVQNWTQELLK